MLQSEYQILEQWETRRHLIGAQSWGKGPETTSGGGAEESRREPGGEQSWVGQDLWEEL